MSVSYSKMLHDSSSMSLLFHCGVKNLHALLLVHDVTGEDGFGLQGTFKNNGDMFFGLFNSDVTFGHNLIPMLLM